MLLVEPPGSPISPENAQAERPQFPVYILAAPGALCMLALALPGALAATMKPAPVLWLVVAGVTLGAVACFWIIAVRSREREVRIPAAIALIGAILLAIRAVLLLL